MIFLPHLGNWQLLAVKGKKAESRVEQGKGIFCEVYVGFSTCMYSPEEAEEKKKEKASFHRCRGLLSLSLSLFSADATE